MAPHAPKRLVRTARRPVIAPACTLSIALAFVILPIPSVSQRGAVGNRLFQPERVGDPAHPALRVNEHHVKPHAGLAPGGVLGQRGGTGG